MLKNYFITALMLSVFISFAACEKDEKENPPTETTITTTTTTTLAPPTTTTTAPQVNPEAEYCKPAGNKFYCGNPVWWKLTACKPDSDGDNQGEGDVYFKDEAAILAQWKSGEVGACVNIKMKDGSEHKLPVVGFGPCITCSEL